MTLKLTLPVQPALSDSSGSDFFNLDMYDTFNMVENACEAMTSHARENSKGSRLNKHLHLSKVET